MKKILVLNTKYKVYGGEDSNILDELTFLKNFYEVEYLEFDNSDRINISGLIGFINNSNNLSNKLLKEKIATFNPDIVYVHNTWFKANLGIFKILKNENITTILKIHNFRFACTNTFLKSKHFKNKNFCQKCGNKDTGYSILNKYFSGSSLKSFLINKYGVKYFKILKTYPIKIFVLNNFYKEYMEKVGIDNEKISISYNPINVNKNFEYNSESSYVLYAGTLNKQKGVKELLESWRNADLDLELLIIGTGPDENELRQEFSNKKIKFLGFKKNLEVIELIKKSRAVLTSTKMYEGQPRLLCEASSFGVPSIYPSYGGMDEYFPKDYKLSFEQYNYSDLKDKIKKLKDHSLLIQESKRVHKHIHKNLSYESINENFKEAFKE